MTANTHIRTIIRNFVEGYVQALEDVFPNNDTDEEAFRAQYRLSLAIDACKKRYSHNPEFFATELQAVEDFAKEVLPKQWANTISQEQAAKMMEETKRD